LVAESSLSEDVGAEESRSVKNERRRKFALATPVGKIGQV